MSEQALLEQAKICLEQGEYETAIALLERCIEDDPEELIYYWYLGLVYLLQENEELAQEIWLSVLLQGNSQEVEQWTAQLISFLEIKVQENITEKKLGNAKIIYESIFFINPDYENIKLLNTLVEALSMFASTLSFNKEYEAALDVYLEALSLNPDCPMFWHSLAFNYYHLEQYVEAEEAIQKAIKLDDSSAQNYHVLGLILEKTNKKSSAIEAYQQAIKHEHRFIDAYNNLAKIYSHQKQLNEAIEIYKQLIEIVPSISKAPIYQNLAIAYQSMENQSMADFYFGNSAYYNKQIAVAITHFQNFLKSNTESHVENIDAYVKLGRCYTLIDQPLIAINLIKKALALFPDNLSLQRVNQSILPIIYQSQEEITFYRNRFSVLLKELVEHLPLNTEKREEALKSIQICTNFYLGYHAENDIELQKQYGKYVYEITKNIYPKWCQTISLDKNINQRKIRVGYISLHLHSLGMLYLGWLKYCDKNKFEIYAYDISGYDENDKSENLSFRENFKTYSNYLKFISGEIDDICSTIIDDKLDILIFTETGLDAKISLLSCLRLAPVQCTSWCHPITSGSPNIDYFLSSDLMEPKNAQEHYSEILVRLPNLGFSIEPFSFPKNDKKRSDFQLRDDSIIYSCCQALFKYLPQHDYLFPSIAQQNKLAQFVFFDCFLGPVITDSFKKRIEKAFKECNLNYEDYCIFLGKLPLEDYLKFNELADIFLDSFGWSGGFSTKDAIACSLPIVTCPGKMMRARQSYGMLQMIGVTETIAETEAEYIEIAVRLGLNHDWRQAVRDKMLENKHRLFNDRECIKGLETFFYEAIQKHSKIT
jgi:predicted O-linked N-acetylglucosamine transferase (SPINDLY family)